MDNKFGYPRGGFTSDYPVVDADYYNPLENVKKDDFGPYVILENGRKVRFPSVTRVKMVGENPGGLPETV